MKQKVRINPGDAKTSEHSSLVRFLWNDKNVYLYGKFVWFNLRSDLKSWFDCFRRGTEWFVHHDIHDNRLWTGEQGQKLSKSMRQPIHYSKSRSIRQHLHVLSEVGWISSWRVSIHEGKSFAFDKLRVTLFVSPAASYGWVFHCLKIMADQ